MYAEGKINGSLEVVSGVKLLDRDTYTCCSASADVIHDAVISRIVGFRPKFTFSQ